MVLGTFLFAHFWCRLTKWPKWPGQGTKGRTRGLQTERSFFYDAGEDFRQRSEAVGLLQASYMLRQLTGKMSAHYSSSKIRNTHFRLFPPDQGPHTVQIVRFLETLQTGYSPFLNLKCCFCKCSIELLFIFLFPYYWPFNNLAVRSLFSVVCLRRLYSRWKGELISNMKEFSSILTTDSSAFRARVCLNLFFFFFKVVSCCIISLYNLWCNYCRFSAMHCTTHEHEPHNLSRLQIGWNYE